MRHMVRLDYDELRVIVKKFKGEGEDIAQLQTKTRDRVRDLHKDWEGDAAEKFFREMEGELLPAVSRLSRALFFTQDTLQRIIKTIHDHDEETKRFFNIDFNQIGPEHLGASAANSWVRMDRYDVWEANRKEFVYPDNTLQPEQTDDASGSAGRLMDANEFTGEVSTVDTTTESSTGPVTPESSDEKESKDGDGYLPDVTTVEVDR